MRRNTLRRILFLLMCVGIACQFGIHRAFAAGPHGERKSAVRVIDRPNLVPSNSLYHGYQVLHFDLVNTDSSRAHRAVFRNGGIQKSVVIPAGQRVRVDFPLPPIATGLFSGTISFDDINEPYNMNSNEKDVYGINEYRYRSSDIKGFDLGNLLVSQGLKNAITETPKTNSDTDISLWPTDRLDYSPYDCIAISENELTRAPKPVQNAIRDWVATGGNLWVFKAKLDSPALVAIPWLKRALETPAALPAAYKTVPVGVRKPLNYIDVTIHEEKSKSDSEDEGVSEVEVVFIDEESDEGADNRESALNPDFLDGDQAEKSNKIKKVCKLSFLWKDWDNVRNLDDKGESDKGKLLDKWLASQSYDFRVPILQGYWGFGQILILDLDPKTVFEKHGVSDASFLASLESEFIGYNQMDLSNCWFAEKGLETTHAEYPIVVNLALPQRSILIIIIAFSLLAGPVGYFVFARRNQRIFLLAFVPLLSLVTAGGIVAFIIVSEGFETDYRYSAVTFLDQQEGLAATIGQFGYYARTSARGFSFDAQTELFPMIVRSDSRWGRSRSSRSAFQRMNWTARQELESGWLSPRMPSYFKFRKTKQTRLKLTFQFPSESGQKNWGQTDTASAPTVVNGLGAPISKLTVRDAQNQFWFAKDIPAGAKAILTRSSISDYNGEDNSYFAYDYYRQNSWSVFLSPPPVGWYVAELEANGPTDSPFLEKGLQYARKINCCETVVGTFGK